MKENSIRVTQERLRWSFLLLMVGWYALCWFLFFLVVVSRHLKELLSLLVELGTQRQFIKREGLASMGVHFLN